MLGIALLGAWYFTVETLTGETTAALVQYDFRDNHLNIISYLGLSTGSCRASRVWVRLRN